MSEDSPVGGWMRDAAAGFDNQRDGRAIDDLTTLPADPARLDYFQRYLNTYFSAEFLPGQGTEEMLGLLKRYGRGGDWLDLAAGTTTLFWGLALSDIRSITCTDLLIEPLTVLDAFARSDAEPVCYRQVRAMLGRPPAHLAALRRQPRRYWLFDAFQPWPAALQAHRFDLITAFGLFSLCRGPDDYAAALGRLGPQLASGGTAIGAGWVRSAAFVAAEGHDNRWVSRDLTVAAATAVGLTVLACEEVPIRGDPLYDRAVIWALRR